MIPAFGKQYEVSIKTSEMEWEKTSDFIDKSGEAH